MYPAFDSHAGRSAPSTTPLSIRQRQMRCPPKAKVTRSNRVGCAMISIVQNRPLNGSETRARQAALSLVTIRVIQPRAVLRVTSTRAEGETGALLQTLAQRRPHQRARRPDSALALHVAHEAECALGDHLAGRAVARIAIARNDRLDPAAIRHFASEEAVVE